MTNKHPHPITPPPELFTEWLSEAMLEHGSKPGTVASIVAEKAVQWGADQELEACVEWLLQERIFSTDSDYLSQLRAARRPKPPSLKEQALIGLGRIEQTGEFFSDGMKDLETIRRALELLPDDTTP